ncbi:MAG: hypothetical protein CMF39_02655 [Legionellaceae bacterium]|nr:hypothetical protein [Legionellaceae bacterium]
MKARNFKDYLKKRLDKNEIAEIESAAKLEYQALRSLQHDISKAVIDYMSKNEIGFNEMVEKLDKSPTQVSKIIKGEANITIATLAHVYAAINKMPRIAAK